MPIEEVLTVRLVAIGLLLLSPVVIAKGGSPSRGPGVYALIIGIDKYPENSLTGVVDGARRFARAVSNSYPNAHIWLETNDFANDVGVNEILFGEIPKIPDGSLLIFYFGGHGERVDYPVSAIPSDTYLLLKDAMISRFYGHSLRLDDVLDAIYRTRKTTAMIFLDCCFSGQTARAIESPKSNLMYLGLRAFMLTSSSSREQTIGGVFTDALLRAWKESQTNTDCFTPAVLEERVQALVDTNSQKYMDTSLAFGRDIQRCIAELDRPSCFLAFAFPNGCKYPLKFYFNDNAKPDRFDPDQDQTFVRVVTRGKVLVKAQAIGGEQVWQRLFTPEELDCDTLLVPVTLPPMYGSPSPVVYVTSLDRTIALLERAGADASHVKQESKIAFANLSPESTAFLPKNEYLAILSLKESQEAKLNELAKKNRELTMAVATPPKPMPPVAAAPAESGAARSWFSLRQENAKLQAELRRAEASLAEARKLAEEPNSGVGTNKGLLYESNEWKTHWKTPNNDQPLQ